MRKPVVLTLLCAIWLTGCAAGGRLVCIGSALPADALSLDIPVVPRGTTFWQPLNLGHVVEARDYQAAEASRADIAHHWHPIHASTVAFAIAPESDDGSVSGWRDLRSTPASVTVSREDAIDPFIWAAIAASSDGAVAVPQDLLGALASEGRLRVGGQPGQIHIGYDHDLVRTLPHYRVIVPDDGTLSHVRGLLAVRPFGVRINEDALLSAGFQLPDGRATNGLAYATAAHLTGDMPRWSASVEARLMRDVLRTHPVNVGEHEGTLAALGFILVATAWVIWTLHRVSRDRARRAVAWTGALVIGWAFVRLAKFNLEDPAAVLFLWYLYYPFMLALPLVLAWTTYFVNGHPRPSLRVALLALIAYDVAVSLLVLTNSWHEQVFIDPAQEYYRYNWGYYAAVVGIALPVLWTIGALLTRAARRRDAGRTLLSGLWVPLIAVFCVAYSMNVPLISRLDFTLTIGLLVIAFYETALRTGLIASNSHHERLFAASPMRLQLLDDNLIVQAAARNARQLDRRELAALSNGLATTASDDETVLLESAPLPGGLVAWERSVADIQRLQSRLADVSKALVQTNRSLAHDQRIRRDHARIITRKGLVADLERVVADDLAEAVQHCRASGPHSLTRVAILLCRTKRRASLLLHSHGGSRVDVATFVLNLEEIARLLRQHGVDVTVASLISDPLDIRVADRLYTEFSRMALWLCALPLVTVSAVLTEHRGNPALRVRHSSTTEAWPGTIEDDGGAALVVLQANRAAQ